MKMKKSIEQRQIEHTSRELWDLYHKTNASYCRDAIIDAIVKLSKMNEEFAKKSEPVT